jgi:hypothetical protein
VKEKNKMLKKVVSVSLLLTIVLSISACNSDKLPSAEEIVAAIMESQERIETYQIDTDMVMIITVESEDETIEMNVEMDYGGSIDIVNAEAKIVMDIKMTNPELGEIEMSETAYVIDGMMYIGTDFAGDSAWIKAEMPADMLAEMDQVESLTALIETAEITILESEVVNGVDCYVVEVVPDADQLWEYISQQLLFVGEEIEMPDIAAELIRKMYDNISVTYYIAKDTHFIMSSSVVMHLELTPEDLGFPEEEGSMTMDITADMLAFDYNQPVSIELPPEAEDAIEVPLSTIAW